VHLFTGKVDELRRAIVAMLGTRTERSLHPGGEGTST
jgi:hypothetical protein